MSLRLYFTELILRVENSEIDNGGKDKNGFYKPTRTVLLRNLNLLKDLYDKPLARTMIQSAWSAVVEELPPDWLVLDEAQKSELKAILK